MKIKAKAKEYQLIVKLKTSRDELIDSKELDRFSRVYLRGFLKPKQIKKNLIEYTGPVGASLYERLKKPISKRDFLFIIEQIVIVVQKLNANNFALNRMVMSVQNVYMNEITKEVQFLYVPVENLQNTSNIIEFIESIVYLVKPADERDNDFASKFIYYFRAIKPFDINAVEKFVLKEDRSVVNTIKKQNTGQSGFMTDKPQHYYEHYDNDGDEPTGLLDEDDEVTGLLDDDEATGLLNQDDDSTGLLYDDNEDDGTALLFENQAQENIKYPILFRVLTDEKISINKPVFRLGKEKSYVDYFVTNNVAVSRSHADIITRGNQYYVKDLNSKNHTYINDQQIPVQFETEIHDGDKLKLGNEEFIFNI